MSPCMEPGVFGFWGRRRKIHNHPPSYGLFPPRTAAARAYSAGESFGHYYEFLGRVGYIPGEVALPRGLTGCEFISMMQSMQGVRNDAKLKEMLSRFELDKNTLKQETKRMSLGSQAQACRGYRLYARSRVLVLDEPTSGLDPVMQESFIDYIHAEKHRGKTIRFQPYFLRDRLYLRPHSNN